MWTAIIITYLAIGGIVSFIMMTEKWGCWKGGIDKKIVKLVKYAGLGILGLLVFSVASYIFGYIWYYFCGGRFVFMDLGGAWYDKLLLGAASLFCFAFLLSGVVIIFKK